MHDVVAVIEAPAEDITLDLDSEEHQKIYRKLSDKPPINSDKFR